MLKNNIKVFVLYIASIFILAFCSIVLACDEYTPSLGLSMLSCIIYCFYFAVGYWLKPQGSNVKNLLSVSSISFIGVVSWFFGYVLKIVFAKFIFGILIGNAIAIEAVIRGGYSTFKGEEWVRLSYLMLPMIIFWSGLELKQWKKRGEPSFLLKHNS